MMTFCHQKETEQYRILIHSANPQSRLVVIIVSHMLSVRLSLRSYARPHISMSRKTKQLIFK